MAGPGQPSRLDPRAEAMQPHSAIEPTSLIEHTSVIEPAEILR